MPNSTAILRAEPKVKFSSPIRILYVGTFTPKDGVDFLIGAFDKLLLYRKDIKLTLIGKGIKRDMDVIGDLIAGNVHIDSKGYVEDDELYDILVNSDILTMTRSNSVFANFGFPFKLSEYLATGNPVVATDVSDVSLYLEDKKNACIAIPEDVDSIYENLKFLTDHQDKAIEIGNSGLDVVKEHFDINKNGEKFVDFLLKL